MLSRKLLCYQYRQHRYQNHESLPTTINIPYTNFSTVTECREICGRSVAHPFTHILVANYKTILNLRVIFYQLLQSCSQILSHKDRPPTNMASTIPIKLEFTYVPSHSHPNSPCTITKHKPQRRSRTPLLQPKIPQNRSAIHRPLDERARQRRLPNRLAMQEFDERSEAGYVCS
jgi:hypothetical protein